MRVKAQIAKGVLPFIEDAWELVKAGLVSGFSVGWKPLETPKVVGDSLPASAGFFVSQRNLNDGSVEGLRHHTLPIETVQYHPEGSPGPLDAAEVFDRFLGHVRASAGPGASS